MMTFADRLRMVLDGQAAHSWAVAHGLPPQKVYDWLKHERTPQRAQLELLAKKTGIPLQWWLDGAPPVPKGADSEPAEHEVPKAMEPHRTVSDILCAQGDYDAWAEAVPVKDLFVPIRYFRHARVSAGHGAQNSHEAPDALLFSKSFLRTIGARPANLFLVRVKGDSMLPTLQAGWTVMLDASRTEVSSGIYVVRLGDEELVKRLEARPGGVIKVISDNRMYDEYDIDLSTAGDDFTVLGKVIWFAGLMQ